jgi:hypothetical protein
MTYEEELLAAINENLKEHREAGDDRAVAATLAAKKTLLEELGKVCAEEYNELFGEAK